MHRSNSILGLLLGGALVAALTTAEAQDSGGRDTGKGAPPIYFVRSARTAESAAIYRAAWKGLEPFYGIMSRERMFDFDGERNRAEEYFAGKAKPKLVVAFDPQAAAWVPKGVTTLRVGPEAGVIVNTRADRARLARLLRLFRPLARKVAVFGSAKETLAGFQTVPCAKAEDARGCDVAWVTEDARLDGRKLREELDALGIPFVSTSAVLPEKLFAVTVRPDPRGLGLQLAAQVLEFSRSGRPFREVSIARHRVVVNLDAARAVKVRVPLSLLARADVVRRTQ